MEKFNNILKEICENHNSIKSIEEKTKELQRTYLDIIDLKERHEQRKKVEDELVRLEEKKEDLQIAIKILQSNAKIALFDEVMPTALEVLAKYKGKPYGPKTEQKIRDEIMKKTDCSFYISSSYGTQVYMIRPMGFSGNTYTIECGSKCIDGMRKILLDKNKIQALELSDITIYYTSVDYIDDIPKRIEELKRLYRNAYEKQQELDCICRQFNKLAVGNMKHLYKDMRLFPKIEI